MNEINFPAGQLQPPAFDPKMDDAPELRQHRRHHRPRADAWLRRLGAAVRRQGQPPRLVDARRRRRVRAPRQLPGRSVFVVRRRRRREGQRQADAGRERRRSRRADPGLSRVADRNRRQEPAVEGRTVAAAALLRRLRAELVRQHASRNGTDARDHQLALPREVPDQRRGQQHARVCRGVCLQGRPADGAGSRRARCGEEVQSDRRQQDPAGQERHAEPDRQRPEGQRSLLHRPRLRDRRPLGAGRQAPGR